jgi:DNA-binding transcriptional regulator YiaG
MTTDPQPLHVRHRERPQAPGLCTIPDDPAASQAFAAPADDDVPDLFPAWAEPEEEEGEGESSAEDADAPGALSKDDAEADDDAHAARLRDVLLLTAQHVPQAEIAARYHVTTRTVRNWIAEARRRRLGTFRRASADDFLAESEWQHATLKAIAWRHLTAAEAAGDAAGVLRWSRQLQSLEVTHSTVRMRCGLFTTRPLDPPLTESAAAEAREVAGARRLRDLAAMTLEVHQSLKGADEATRRSVLGGIVAGALQHLNAPDPDPSPDDAAPLF